eukprot:Lithocolla_globosa_v1_NODE_4175_length_1489_cov_53.351878.p2 type:complete len:129 gc:universal NODE_4175_length_1489_cov_53.351878:1446-1060(-)
MNIPKGGSLSSAPTPANTPVSLSETPVPQNFSMSSFDSQKVSLRRGEEDEEDIIHPPEVRRRVNALKNLQHKHAILDAEYREEILAIEAKYLEKFKPLYDEVKRNSRSFRAKSETDVENNKALQIRFF